MPRPPDNYTHSQFETVASDHQGETVQCVHCRNWTGSIKTLNRKKAHLMNCPQYAQWRAAGNGQDLAPPNKYQKRDGSTLHAWDRDAGSNTYHNSSPYTGGGDYTPTAVRGRNLDISKFFDEFWDDSSAQKVSDPFRFPIGTNPDGVLQSLKDPAEIVIDPKTFRVLKIQAYTNYNPSQCMRVRCLSCGFVRAKNTTRQVEHLASCQPFLTSTEGQAALADGDLELTPSNGGRPSYPGGSDIWRGGAPNPNLQVGSAPRSGGPNLPGRMAPPSRPAPSLVSYLLNKRPDRLAKATQQQFLSHAGCGTLSAGALSRWLGQNSHVSRALITFIGCLIGKVRLPETSHSKSNTQFRALDLLISTISNLRKELDFIENTKRKYGLHADCEPPSPITKAYTDLLASASDPRSSLLEGMVALWSTEHCYCVSWQYASTFADTVPSSNYSVPSYLTNNQMEPYGNGSASARPPNGSNQHISALQEALIPNWTSREFSKFVDACRAIVDELANAETTGSGREQLGRCESQYQQVLFLWERLWPEVDGMGQEPDLEEADRDGSAADPESPGDSGIVPGPSGANGSGNPPGKAHHIEIDGVDDSEDVRDSNTAIDPADSPYGGTGLGAVAAANQAD